MAIQKCPSPIPVSCRRCCSPHDDCHPISFLSLSTLLLQVVCGLPGVLLPSGARVTRHHARAYPSFCSMKRLGVFLLPSGWNVSPSHGYPAALSSPVHVHLECSQDNSQKKETQGFILTTIRLFFFGVGGFLRLQKFVESSSVFKLILDDWNTSLVAYFN